VTQNRFEVLATEEQDYVFMQTDTELISPTIKTLPNPSKVKPPNIVLKNV